MPDIVLLDGILFLSNSPNQKAFNGLDALAQVKLKVIGLVIVQMKVNLFQESDTSII